MNTSNLVSVSNETYSDIEDKIENNFFYKVVNLFIFLYCGIIY